MKTLGFALALVAMLAPGVSHSKEKVVYEKKTKLDFEDKAVDGQFLTPEGMAVKADKNLDFDTLLAPKANFNKELQRSPGAVR